MAIYTLDHFTDADGTHLSTHTPDVGSAYSVYLDDGIIESNALTDSDFGNGVAYANPAPSTADYKVSAQFIVGSGGSSGTQMLMVRVDSGPPDWYAGGWDQGTAEWQLQLRAGGTITVLDSASSPSMGTSTSRLVELECHGSLLTLTVDGSLVLSASDATLTAIGKAGLQTAGLLSGWWNMDDFTVEDGGGTGPGVHVLTGRGVDTIGGQEWLSISLSGRPSTLSNGNAEPTNWYHVGMISWGSDNGAMTAYPVTRDLDLVRIPPDMTQLWYEFVAGVTATITELAAP